LTTARKRAAVRAALSDAGVVFADGQPLVWLQRAAGETSARRIAGTDLLLELAGRAGPHELRHAFFGSSSSTLASVAAELSRRRPEIEIAGLVSPPMAADARELGGTWLATLAALEPDIVWCCLGAPKQELWMRRFASALSPAVLVGIGAAVEFVAGTRRRAPAWMQRVGLEWAHRLAAEPRRLAGRYVLTNAEFAVACATGVIANRRRQT
jgi:N-acetylglucosaminyldiphosphoundecaprenol N-acetyl-beta-D-mannosaminyltransferase